MSEKYKFDDPEGTYFIMLGIVFWSDLFTRKDYKYVIVDSLRFCQQEKRFGYQCVVPDAQSSIYDRTNKSATAREYFARL